MAVIVDRETVEKTLSNGTFVATVKTVGEGEPVINLTRIGTPSGTAIESLRQLAQDATEMADALDIVVSIAVARRTVQSESLSR
jgi:hypothetical protein